VRPKLARMASGLCSSPKIEQGFPGQRTCQGQKNHGGPEARAAALPDGSHPSQTQAENIPRGKQQHDHSGEGAARGRGIDIQAGRKPRIRAAIKAAPRPPVERPKTNTAPARQRKKTGRVISAVRAGMLRRGVAENENLAEVENQVRGQVGSLLAGKGSRWGIIRASG